MLSLDKFVLYNSCKYDLRFPFTSKFNLYYTKEFPSKSNNILP